MIFFKSFFHFFYGTIKSKLITNVILIHAVLMSFVVYDLVERQSLFMKEQMQNKGAELVSLLALNATNPLLNNDLVALDELINGFEGAKDIYMAFLLDENGKVKASTDKKYLNKNFNDEISLKLLKQSQISLSDNTQLSHTAFIDSMHKIKIKDDTIGYARVVLNTENLSHELNIITTKGLLYIFLAIFIGALFAWLSIRKTTYNLNAIASIASLISEQKFDVSFPKIKGNDEVAKVSHAFEVMIHSIEAHIIELTKREETSHWQANHDVLTGLKNRRAFEYELEKAIEESAEHNGLKHALLFLDLDKFKVVNDSAGHLAGDRCLEQVALLLESLVGKDDILARFGGDEFGVVLKNCDSECAEEKAKQLIACMESFSFSWNERKFRIGVCVGMVMIDGSVKTALELLSLSDTACYIAKENGINNLHILDVRSELFAKLHHEMDWIAKIHDALSQNLFTLYAQKIESLKGENDHYEILIRMRSPGGELFYPDSFLPSAARYSLMPKIDLWVIETLFKLITSNQSLQNTSFAINLSGQSLMKDNFEQDVETLFKTYRIDGEMIIFEITETSAMSNFKRVTQFIERFKALGCQFSLDDFGTGLSSFAYLKNFKVNYLKIDGSFVRNIAEEAVDEIIVDSISQISSLLGLKTIAEYVENDTILTIIKKIGIDYAQGYGIEKPAPIETVFKI